MGAHSVPLFFSQLVAATALKVTVCGGSGFVGSRVCKTLVEAGASVTSVSKSGAPPEWAKDASWTSDMNWVANNFVVGSREALQAAIGSPDAIVSCVGTVGFDRQGLILGNGKANEEVATAASAIGGVQRLVYVSVSPEVDASVGWLTGRSAQLPNWGEGYFEGKRQAEAAYSEAAATLGASTCFIKPSFVYGGDSFGLFPPRVTAGYGSGVEELLSASLVQSIADKMPGLIKVALRPPVNVDAVAGAAAKAALGDVTADVLDSTAGINGAADQPPATGLTDLGNSIKGKIEELTAA